MVVVMAMVIMVMKDGRLNWVVSRENPWRSRLEAVQVELEKDNVEKDRVERVERVVTKQGKINTRRHVRKQLSLYGSI